MLEIAVWLVIKRVWNLVKPLIIYLLFTIVITLVPSIYHVGYTQLPTILHFNKYLELFNSTMVQPNLVNPNQLSVKNNNFRVFFQKIVRLKALNYKMCLYKAFKA